MNAPNRQLDIPIREPVRATAVDPLPLGRTLAVSALAWLLFSLVNASQVYVSMLDHGHSYPRMVAFNLAVWGVWAVLTPLVVLLALRLPLIPLSFRAVGIHGLCAVVAASFHVAVWTELTVVMRPYDDMGITDFAGNYMKALWYRAQFELLVYGLIVGLTGAVDYARRLHRRELEAERLEAQLASAKLHTLELQLRPHFLFNTLHTVTGFVRAGQNHEAVEMIVRLSDLLHQSLAAEHTPLIRLSREIELLGAYLEIERIRFSDRLTVDIEVDSAVEVALIPPFVLQPLAENAIRHGISKVAGPVELALIACRRGDRLWIELTNSGPPLGSGTGLGLGNCRQRLRALWGEAASLTLCDRPGGVSAELDLPFVTSEYPHARAPTPR